MIESQNQKETDRLNTEITQLRLRQSALTASYNQPIENRTHEELKVRLKIPTMCHRTLKPLFDTEPEILPIIASKRKDLFIQKLIGLQKMLVNIYFRQTQNFNITGVKIVQDVQTMFRKDDRVQFTGLFKVIVNMEKQNLIRPQLISLFDHGMIHQLIFTLVEQTRLFQEMMRWTIGNIVVDKPVTITISPKIPVSYGLTEEPAYHQILIEPDMFESIMESQNFQTIEEPEFYEELMQQPIPKRDDWMTLVLLT